MTMDSSAAQVAVDIMRELGREEEARWLEYPEAVRWLLQWPFSNSGCLCTNDPENLRWDPPEHHERGCFFVEALLVLQDPRLQSIVDYAYDQATDEWYERSVGGPFTSEQRTGPVYDEPMEAELDSYEEFERRYGAWVR